MGFNDEMERYMRGRRRRAHDYSSGTEATGQTWWDRVFFPKKDEAHEFTPDEMAKVTAMEQDIQRGEEHLEAAETPGQHEQLAEKQEERVSLYERFLRMFRFERRMEDEYEHIDGEQLHGAAMNAPDVTDDFRTLATIQVKWFERLPKRIKEEFRESDDFDKYKDILQRRGVAKK
jgi:hypothetical protein